MTPKIDRICTEFVRRIGEQFKTAFTIGTAMPDTNNLTASTVEDYVIRAMLMLYNNYWTAEEMSSGKFVSLFPELVRHSDEVDLTAGIYAIDNPYKDFKALIGGLAGGKSVRLMPPEFYSSAKSRTIASTQYPAAFDMDGSIYVIPTTITNLEMVYLSYPVDPLTGAFLTQNGSYDSPFKEHWNSEIAKLAQDLFNIEVQETA